MSLVTPGGRAGGAAGRREAILSLGEWSVTDDAEATLTCLGLGSCVALVLLERSAGVGAMAHMVLPDSTAGRPSEGSAKFVDQAVPLLLEHMAALGAIPRKMSVALVGGATMLTGAAFTGRVNIGERNIEAARAALSAHRLAKPVEELGGTHGRTVRLQMSSGTVTVSAAGSAPQELAI